MNNKVSVIAVLTAGFLSSCGTYMSGTRDESIQQTLNPEIGDQNLVEIQRLKNKIKEKDTEITFLRWKYMKNLQQKENELKQKQDKLEALKIEHEAAQNKIAEQKQTIAGLNRNFEAEKQLLKTEIENKKQEITQLKTNFNNQKAELENTKNTLVQKEQKITELQAKIVKLIEKSWSYATEIKKRDKKITELQSQLTNKTQEMQTKIRDLEAEKQTLQSQLNSITQERDNFRDLYNDTKRDLDRVNGEFKTAIESIQNKDTELQNKNILLGQKDSKITELNNELKEIKKQLQDKDKNLTKLNKSLELRNNLLEQSELHCDTLYCLYFLKHNYIPIKTEVFTIEGIIRDKTFITKPDSDKTIEFKGRANFIEKLSGDYRHNIDGKTSIKIKENTGMGEAIFTSRMIDVKFKNVNFTSPDNTTYGATYTYHGYANGIEKKDDTAELRHLKSHYDTQRLIHGIFNVRTKRKYSGVEREFTIEGAYGAEEQIPQQP